MHELQVSLLIVAQYIYLNVHSTMKISVERVNQEKRLVEFEQLINLAGKQQ